MATLSEELTLTQLDDKGFHTYSSSIMVDLKRQIIQAAKLIVIIQMVESGVFRNGKTSSTWSYRNHIRSRST
ncbi:hypothetical protein DF209_13940 [Pectobacterium polaris]|nr:hypothetical protein DF209_13940 [Pectobacterium polaris]